MALIALSAGASLVLSGLIFSAGPMTFAALSAVIGTLVIMVAGVAIALRPDPAPAASAPPPQQTQATGPTPPADIVDDSANWQSQGLGQYLERNGLLSDGSTDTTAATSDSYDPNGFFLSDGPNATPSDRRSRVLRMLGDDPSAPVPPESFNLF